MFHVEKSTCYHANVSAHSSTGILDFIWNIMWNSSGVTSRQLGH